MLSLLYFAVSLFIGYRVYREEKRRGRWSNSKFFVTIGFAALEVSLVWVAMLPPLGSRWFTPTLIACGVVAVANFAWFIPLMRSLGGKRRKPGELK